MKRNLKKSLKRKQKKHNTIWTGGWIARFDLVEARRAAKNIKGGIYYEKGVFVDFRYTCR